jgi:hypothetical protein
MAAASIEVNFFTVAMPERSLPFLIRDLGGGKLREDELGWHPTASDDREATMAVLVGEGATVGYRKEEHAATSVSPSVIKRLLELGLLQSLKRRDYLAFKPKFGLEAFNPDETIRTSASDFLILRRGVAFSIDHVTYGGPRQFGFFVTPVTRQEFRVGLDDQHLAAAALGHTVHFTARGTVRSGILSRIDGDRGVAFLERRGEKEEVELAQVSVPASREIVAEYCRQVSRPDLARDIRTAARVASFRYRPNGQRNVRWLREQVEFVCRWLIGASHNGRIPFNWPYSGVQLTVATKPSVAHERRRP